MNKTSFILVVLLTTPTLFAPPPTPLSTTSMTPPLGLLDSPNYFLGKKIILGLIGTACISGAYATLCFAESLMLSHDEKNNPEREKLIKKFKYSAYLAAGTIVAIVPVLIGIRCTIPSQV